MAFNFNKLRDFIPKELPRLPAWTAAEEDSSRPGSAQTGFSADPDAQETQEIAMSIADPEPMGAQSPASVPMACGIASDPFIHV